MASPEPETTITTLDQHDIAELPSSGHLMTVLVEIPPKNPGTPPHRHSGPVYGYLLEGEMIFELEGDAPVSSARATRSGSPAGTGSTTRPRTRARTGPVSWW